MLDSYKSYETSTVYCIDIPGKAGKCDKLAETLVPCLTYLGADKASVSEPGHLSVTFDGDDIATSLTTVEKALENSDILPSDVSGVIHVNVSPNAGWYTRVDYDPSADTDTAVSFETPVGHLIDDEPTVIDATLTRQVWVMGYANDMDVVHFNARPALDAIAIDEIPNDPGALSEGALDFGDDLYREAVELGLVEEWDGPYNCAIKDYEAYDTWYEARCRDTDKRR